MMAHDSQHSGYEKQGSDQAAISSTLEEWPDLHDKLYRNR